MSIARLRIATRGSALALWQARWVASRLAEIHAGLDVELVEVKTAGDRDRSTPLSDIGGVGLFTKEIQQAVLDGRADVAVHSMKDLPSQSTPGLRIIAVPPRESVADVLISTRNAKLTELAAGARVGTSSTRRAALLRHARPDLELVNLRGNVETRLAHVLDRRLDAIVLAEAGLARLGLEAHIAEQLEPPRFLPAVGQGALAVECRHNDKATHALLSAIDDPATRAAVTAERVVMAALQGGCSVPLGAWARWGDSGLVIDAVVLDAEGKTRIDVAAGPENDPILLGGKAAQMLSARGAERLLSRTTLPT